MTIKPTVKDPVCAMDVSPDDALSFEHEGTEYFFAALLFLTTFWTFGRELPSRGMDVPGLRKLV